MLLSKRNECRYLEEITDVAKKKRRWRCADDTHTPRSFVHCTVTRYVQSEGSIPDLRAKLKCLANHYSPEQGAGVNMDAGKLAAQAQRFSV
jgi:hypothetical protein